MQNADDNPSHRPSSSPAPSSARASPSVRSAMSMPSAVIGDRVELVSHVVVHSGVTLGEGCKVSPMAILGGPPQNTKHKGGRTTLVIGRNCTIREGVTMHRGTDTSRGETTVGDNGNFLAYAHIAHDCIVGNNVTMANVATLGGHVEVGDFVTHRRPCRRPSDVPHRPPCLSSAAARRSSSATSSPTAWSWATAPRLRGLNVIGMKRSGVPRADIFALRRAYRMIFDPLAHCRREHPESSSASSPIVADRP